MIGEKLLFAPCHRNLRLAIIFFLIPFLYSRLFNHYKRNVQTVEQAIAQAWEAEIIKPGSGFKRVVVGFNCNVDLVAPGVSIIESLNTTCEQGKRHEKIDSLAELYETFTYFFQKGAAAERYISSNEVFNVLVRQAENTRKAQKQLGGNAAIMAERIASKFPATDVYLVGAIGPRAQALLHPAVKRTNSTRIVKVFVFVAKARGIQDELHVILEYKKGEILADWVSPGTSRFIAGHDSFSASLLVIEMLFKAVLQFKPDLVIVAGVHLLEIQPPDVRLDKLTMLRRNILQISSKIPVHLQLGTLGDGDFLLLVLKKLIPHVDSLGINEQTLAYLSHTAGGPYMEEYPIQGGTTHPHKVVEMLYWLMKTYGRDLRNQNSPNYKYRLQRIHFHCMTYHLMVSIGTDWSNLGAALAAGARIAGKISCNVQESHESDVLEVRMSHTFPLDKHVGKIYQFDPQNPLSSWIRDDIVFVFTPVLVCKFPIKTVGTDDTIAATSLMYSQFYRFQNFH